VDDHADRGQTAVCRGVRGATMAEANTPEAILSATCELLEALVAANGIRPAEIASVLFSATRDLDAAYPAEAARGAMGWTDVPLMCMQELNVRGSLPRAIRVLIHWNTTKAQHEIHHIYRGGAETLRPDLAQHATGRS
jgi:chorismate mutase